MDHFTCDACGNGLLLESNVRYEVRIEVKSAYDPLEITREDLEQDTEAEMKRLARQMERLTEQQAMDQVYREFRFDLCFPCQRRFIANPLATGP